MPIAVKFLSRPMSGREIAFDAAKRSSHFGERSNADVEARQEMVELVVGIDSRFRRRLQRRGPPRPDSKRTDRRRLRSAAPGSRSRPGIGAEPCSPPATGRHSRAQGLDRTRDRRIPHETAALVARADIAKADVSADLDRSKHRIRAAELDHGIGGLRLLADVGDLVRSEAAVRQLDRDRRELPVAWQIGMKLPTPVSS